jgi:hypothetical protein
MLRCVCHLSAAAAVLAAAVSAIAGPATPDDAAAELNARFGDQIRRAESAPSQAGDVALAGRLLAAARAKNVSPALLPLLCEKAYDLAIKHPEGQMEAVAAMKLLADKAPDKADAARDKILAAYQAQYSKARGAEKTRAGEALVDMLVRCGDAKAARRDFDGAVALYRRASTLAPSLRGVNREELQAKLDFALTRQAFLRKIERLQAGLRADPKDQTARDEIVRLYVVEFDDPVAAAGALDLDVKDLATRYVLLAGMKIENLPERALTELGAWYRSLADKSSPQGKVTALVRAQGYYERFLAVHPAGDAARTDAARALDETDAILAKIPGALVKVTVMKDAEFASRLAPKLPPAGNVAMGGLAGASSHWGERLPANALLGNREGIQWTLNGPEGWFEVRWSPPARGRYILLVGRNGTPGNDPWGEASIAINAGRPHKIEGMSSGEVCLVDLGIVVPIGSLRIDIKGSAYPGLADLEIHPRMADRAEGLGR